MKKSNNVHLFARYMYDRTKGKQTEQACAEEEQQSM